MLCRPSLHYIAIFTQLEVQESLKVEENNEAFMILED